MCFSQIPIDVFPLCIGDRVILLVYSTRWMNDGCTKQGAMGGKVAESVFVSRCMDKGLPIIALQDQELASIFRRAESSSNASYTVWTIDFRIGEML